jgi:RimJ/RimL family protein N-acetyltransferase
MIAGDSHGKGFAAELARAVVDHAIEQLSAESAVATVDIPNRGSIRVLGSDETYLSELGLSQK